MTVTRSLHALAAMLGVASSLAISSTNSSAPGNFSNPAIPILGDGTIDLGVATAAFEKAKAVVAGMTNAEKIKVITGDDVRSKWTALSQKDGVSGVNNAYFVSGFASPNGVSMTWNPDLMEAHSKAIGEEFYKLGYNLIMGPVSSPLGRDPYGGRLPESYSVEPYLAGIMMGKAVKGMNDAGVVAVGRHYLLNEQETNRMNGGYSANVADKTINEVYLWPFADAVHSGLMGVMCSMNKVNGTYACESDKYLNGYLKTNIGFPGLVTPDVQSQHNALPSANGGLDLGSSRIWSQTTMLKAIESGTLTQDRLDDMAIRNIIGYYFVGLDDGKQPEAIESETPLNRHVRGNHSAIIRQVGQEAMVLLKNTEGSAGLPLKEPGTVAIFGAHAGPVMAGPNFAFSVAGSPTETYQGHLAATCGSGDASMPYLISPYEVMNMRVADYGGMMWWILNNTYTASKFSGIPGGGGFPGGDGGDGGDGGFPGFPFNTTFPGFPGGGGNRGNSSFPGFPGGGNSTHFGGGPGGGFGFGGTGATPSINQYSKNAEVCVVFINAWSGEGGDRKELSNADQDKLVSSVAAECNNTVVVGNFAGPRILDAWIENENVTAVLYSGLLGQESGRAIVDVLFGDVNPSGKLTHTVAKAADDYNTKTCTAKQCDFTEGVFLDYRYFQSQNASDKVRFPFGHGLSYTTFKYGDVSAAVTDEAGLASKFLSSGLTLGGQAGMFDEVLTVKTSVANSGSVDGAEVAQLYITFPDEAAQPVRVLRGFQKVNLAAGASSDVTFSVRRRDISYWDEDAQKFAVAKGEYTLAVGSSSEDIRGTTTVTI